MAKKILFTLMAAGALALVPSFAHAEDAGTDGGTVDLAPTTVAQPDAASTGNGPANTDTGCSSLPGRANSSAASLMLGASIVAASLLLRRRA